MKTRLFVAAFLLAVDPFLPNCGVHASIVDYGVYKVQARITNYGPDIIDSKTPGLWSTDANAFVSDSYGPVSASWSIHPLTANEAQVNIDMSEYTYGSINVYRGDAGQTGEVHFNYHSDTPFTVNYYWDFTWGIYPFNNFDFNWFAQQVRLRIRDALGNELYPPGTFPPAPGTYPYSGHYTGSTSINLGAGNRLFIVSCGGTTTRWAGEWESLSCNVYLDFDGGYRLTDVDYNHDGSVNLVDYSFFAQTWQLSAGQDGYLDVCDVVNDDIIDFKDMPIFLKFWLD